ncbi:MAG: methyltetrahydrofolate cobalamin methyltransferase [Clostridiales bacterium]|nr:methyltetrahydrofolate cobalamin methyltransferase [Clostridiales bacterium]MCF8021944.1 methyltetrahydrofolate cobalamin methyltransferase [Clostridiales bacterium]
MILIGERINGMFNDIKEAIKNKDPEPIKQHAIKQEESGAGYLDVNTGPTVDKENQPAVMEWLIQVAQEVSKLPCCIDTTNLNAIEAGLKVHKGKALINSTTADQAKMDIFLPLAAKYEAGIIGLTMNERGVPKTSADRIALAMELVVNCDMQGIPTDDLFLDPLILPCNVAQEHAPEVLETLQQIKTLSDPAPKSTIGLSNVSQSCVNRNLINRTYLIMAIASGLDSAIVDVYDSSLVEEVAATKILKNEDIYCDSFVKTYIQS